MTREEIAKRAATTWSRCFKCDGIVNATGCKCEMPNSTCLKWYNGYRAACIALEESEKDLALTTDDIGTIFDLVRKLQVKYTATVGCYEEVLQEFNKLKNENYEL